MQFDTVFYHSPCSDGNAAAWVFSHFMPKAKLVPISHDTKIEDVSNQSIVFTDICPKWDVLLELSKQVKHITILDHHKTTQTMIDLHREDMPDNVEIDFDLKRAGCQITWDYLARSDEKMKKKRPWFLDYIADRDLWKWSLPDSKEINLALYHSGRLTIESLEQLYRVGKDDDLFTKISMQTMVEQGTIINKIQEGTIEKVASEAREAKLKDTEYRVWVCSVPRHLRSDVGNKLCERKMSHHALPDFVAIYHYEFQKKEWYISLRGHDASPDLSVICEKFGGGGHAKAAGFSIFGGLLNDYFTPI